MEQRIDNFKRKSFDRKNDNKKRFDRKPNKEVKVEEKPSNVRLYTLIKGISPLPAVIVDFEGVVPLVIKKQNSSRRLYEAAVEANASFSTA